MHLLRITSFYTLKAWKIYSFFRGVSRAYFSVFLGKSLYFCQKGSVVNYASFISQFKVVLAQHVAELQTKDLPTRWRRKRKWRRQRLKSWLQLKPVNIKWQKNLLLHIFAPSVWLYLNITWAVEWAAQDYPLSRPNLRRWIASGRGDMQPNLIIPENSIPIAPMSFFFSYREARQNMIRLKYFLHNFSSKICLNPLGNGSRTSTRKPR